jgi:phage baseplate assembly protein gpV
MHCASRLLSVFMLAFAACLSAEEPPMATRYFKIPPAFLGYAQERTGAAPAASTNPIADGTSPATVARLRPHKTAKEILVDAHVEFPPGATAFYEPMSGTLTVHNTPQELAVVAAVIELLVQYAPSTVAYTLTIIEGPSELIRQANAAASRKSNARAELSLLLDYAKNAGANVHVVGDAFLETKSHTHASSKAGIEYSFANQLKLDLKSRASVTLDMRPAGLIFEIEPYLSPDGFSMVSHVSLDVHSAPPSSRQVKISEPITGNLAEFPVTEFYDGHVTAEINSMNGHTKLIGVIKPNGRQEEKEDILWAAFLTGTARRIKVLPCSKPLAAEQIIKTPPGLKAAVFNIPDGLFETMVEIPQPLQSYFETVGIKTTEGATAEQKNGVLSVVETTENIERIAALIDECVRFRPKSVNFTLHTVQATAAFLRDLTYKASVTSDQTDMWNTVQSAAARGEATFINSIFLETKPGTRTMSEAVSEHQYISEFGTNAKGLPHLAFGMRPVGSLLSIEPTLGSDGNTVDIAFSYELHPAPSATHHEHFLDPASTKRFEMPVSSFGSIKTTAVITMAKGGTQLISINKPEIPNNDKILWATFLRCDVAPQAPPPTLNPKTPADPQAWDTRTYRVPPDFLPRRSDVRVPITARMTLESQGVTFPEGAMATYTPATSTLLVKNTQENLALVENFLIMLTKLQPSIIAATTHVLQGSGTLLRRLTAQAACKWDQRAELNELLAGVKAGTVKYLHTSRHETAAFTNSTVHQGHEHNAISGFGVNDQGEPTFAQQKRNVGLNVEFEPSVGADGMELDLGLSFTSEFHTAEPVEHREYVIDTQGRRLEFPLTDYQVAKLTTATMLHDGVARLLMVYKPTGKPEFEKEDVLQAIFITCDLLRVGE